MYKTAIGLAVLALSLALLYIWPVIRPTREKALFLPLAAFGALTVCALAGIPVVDRWARPLARWIDADARGEASRDAVRAAFQAIVSLPNRVFVLALIAWPIGSALLLTAWVLVFPTLTPLRALGTAMALCLGGISSQAFTTRILTRGLAPEREALASAIADLDGRARLVRRVPLGRELAVTFAGLCVLNLVYGICLVHVERSETESANVYALRAELFGQARERAETSGSADAAAALAALPKLAPIDPPLAEVLLHQGPLVLISLLTVTLVAVFAAKELVEAARSLRDEVDLVASGDLRTARCLESPDEFGELARSFGRLAAMLRLTVRGYAETVRGMEAVTETISGAAGDMTGATRRQVESLGAATGSMQSLRSHVEEIARSTQALSSSMDEHGQHVALLVTGGQDLHHSASILSAQVSEVSSRIGSLIQSSDRISSHGASLGQRASKAAEGLRLVASAAQSVDADAAELARLAARTVAAADQGRERMHRAAVGMEAIRTATETADDVIRRLGERARQIGRIVDVIDDVADETGLLALNAAIIAAQAGSAGSAFKVVADEVKSLSERVLRSTKEIAEVVGSVQEESSRAIDAIALGVASVRDGVVLSQEAGEALDEIVDAANASGVRIQHIVAEARRQSTSAAEMVALMSDVQAGVQDIQELGRAQSQTSHAVLESSGTMEGVAGQMHATAERQSGSVARMRDGIERVRLSTSTIRDALAEQSATSGSIAGSLDQVLHDTRSHESSVVRLGEAVDALARQAESLRRDVAQFETA
jgi:methyl-accepting chemotaxis protein